MAWDDKSQASRMDNIYHRPGRRCITTLRFPQYAPVSVCAFWSVHTLTASAGVVPSLVSQRRGCLGLSIYGFVSRPNHPAPSPIMKTPARHDINFTRQRQDSNDPPNNSFKRCEYRVRLSLFGQSLFSAYFIVSGVTTPILHHSSSVGSSCSKYQPSGNPSAHSYLSETVFRVISNHAGNHWSAFRPV